MDSSKEVRFGMRTICDHWEGAEEDGDLNPRVRLAAQAAWTDAAKYFRGASFSPDEIVDSMYEEWWDSHWQEFVNP